MVMVAGVATLAFFFCGGTFSSESSSAWNPFASTVEKLARSANEARLHGDLDLAQSLVDEGLRQEGFDQAPLIYVQGLLMRDRGHAAEAAEVLGRAADIDSTSDARVEQAATLVPIGRWPEAVEVLRRAYDERGSRLRADALVNDSRFAPLVGFAPFQALVRDVRAEQIGPFGGILLKLGQLDDSVRESGAVLAVSGQWMQVLGRLISFRGTAIIVVLILALLFSLGAAQTGFVRAPWTLFVGLFVSSSLWVLGSYVAVGGVRSALTTVFWACGVVVAPWLVRALAQGVRRYRAQRGLLGAFSPATMQQTFDLVDELHRQLRAITQSPAPISSLQRAELLETAARVGLRLQPLAAVKSTERCGSIATVRAAGTNAEKAR